MTGFLVTVNLLTPPDHHEPAPFSRYACGCFALHRVRWEETRYGKYGDRIIYRFSAPDAESVRIAIRRAGIPYDSISHEVAQRD
jgi:hypothetical protein